MTINSDQILVRDTPEDKLGILDLELDINNNEKVDVEIQLIERANFAERLLFYFSRLYASEMCLILYGSGAYTKAFSVVPNSERK